MFSIFLFFYLLLRPQLHQTIQKAIFLHLDKMVVFASFALVDLMNISTAINNIAEALARSRIVMKKLANFYHRVCVQKYTKL
jgi:hypothetical protein